MAMTPREKLNLRMFTNRASQVIEYMKNNTKYPALSRLYEGVLDNVRHVPVNVKSGSSLESNAFGTTFGENIKRVNGPFLQSAIRIPHDHLFENEKVRLDGGLTLLHEYSHVPGLGPSAQAFTARVGLQPFHADEFFADILSAHIAKNMGFSKDVIGRHLFARRSYFKFPIDRFALEGPRGVRKEIDAGRFTPRRTLRPEEPSPIRTPTERVGIFAKTQRGMPGIFPGSGKNRPHFNPRV